MTPATAIGYAYPTPFAPESLAHTPEPQRPRLRLLTRPTRLAPPGRPALGPVRTRSGEVLTLVLVAAATHALLVWGLWQGRSEPHRAAAPQEIELLRPPAESPPEPPKPTPPRPEPQPPQAQARPAAPAPTLRTAPAEAPRSEAMSIPENLSAPPSTAPVVVAAPTPPAPPSKPDEPVSEPNAYAGYLNNPPPVYPKAAQRQGLQGRVLLRVYVLASGQVGQVELKQSSGKPVLDDAALAAVRAWSFVPAKRGSTPIDGWTTVPIDFKLAA